MYGNCRGHKCSLVSLEWSETVETGAMSTLQVFTRFLLLMDMLAAFCGGLSSSGNSEDEVINVLVLHPLKFQDFTEQLYYTEGPIIVPVIDMAVEQINQRDDILPGYSLKFTVANSACNLQVPDMYNFVRAFFHSGGAKFAGIVSAACSDVTQAVSAITGMKGVAILNFHIASSPTLSDRSRHGYAFGTVGSSHAYVGMFLQLMKQNKWESVAVLYEESKIFYLTAYYLLVEELPKVYPQARIALSVPISMDELPLSSISDHQLRVVFVITSFPVANRMMCLVSARYPHLTYPAYQFIFIQSPDKYFHYPASFVYNSRPYNCSVKEITQAINGFLLTHTKLDVSNRSAPLVSGASFNEYYEKYKEKLVNESTTEWANPVYDGVWSLALALNNSIPRLRSELGLDLADYTFGNKQAADVIRDEVLKLRFNGASGFISFRNNTGYTSALVDLYQLIDNTSNLVGYFDENEQKLVTMEKANFVDNSFESIELLVHPALASLYLLATVVLLVLVIVTHVLTLVYHSFKSIKATSYRLSQLAFVGCYIMVNCLVCATVQQVTPSNKIDTNSLCVFQSWLLPLGVTLVLGTVTAKTWRLYRIFVHRWNPGRFLQDWVLFTAVLVLAAVDIIMCSIWTATFPFTPLRQVRTTDHNTIEVVFKCNSEHYYAWFSAVTIYQFLIMGSAFVLALLTVNIRREGFRTKSVTFLVYSLTVTFFLGLPVCHPEDGKPVSSELALCSTLTHLPFCDFSLFHFPVVSSCSTSAENESLPQVVKTHYIIIHDTLNTS